MKEKNQMKKQNQALLLSLGVGALAVALLVASKAKKS